MVSCARTTGPLTPILLAGGASSTICSEAASVCDWVAEHAAECTKKLH